MLTIWDFILPLIYLLIIFFFADLIRKKHIKENDVYQYYVKGLFAKIAGGLALCLIYTQYYTGGDTVNYHNYSVSLLKLFSKAPFTYFSIMGGNLSFENYTEFDMNTGFPGEYWLDPATYSVVRLTSLFQIFSFQSFLVTTILVSSFSYLGTWRLYLLFTEFYPKLKKEFAIAILFVPSVLFWGSGILKDTFTLMGASWFTYSFYKVFIKPEKVHYNLVCMILNAALIIMIKPYIFIALMPGSLLWLTFEKVKNIQNWFFKFLTGPLIIAICLIAGYFTFSSISQNLGQFSSVDKVLNKAVATQQDLKQDYYHGNSFDIGDFDPSVSGVLSKLPEGIMAGLFRPFLWESKNIVMLIAGIENFFLLILTCYLLVKLKPIKTYKIISTEPLLFFSIIFALFFAFSVGLTTSNFGAMVRYKIPAVPFYLSGLFIIRHFYQKTREAELIE